MYKKYLFTALLSVFSYSTVALAASTTTASNSVVLPKAQSAEFKSVQTKLSNMLGLKVNSVKASPMAGIVEVMTEQGLFYASADGNFLLHGKMYGLGTEVSNLTEESLAKVRIDGMAEFSDAMIVFPAKDEKHVVTVFTDITCGYCRKMHDQIDDYNDKGITVRYLAYPRSGVKNRSGQYSQGFKDLRSIWCHEDPQGALTKAKQGSNIAARVCDKPIESEFTFGRQIGVNGTPAIILENGMMVPGYQDPSKLFTLLEASQQGS